MHLTCHSQCQLMLLFIMFINFNLNSILEIKQRYIRCEERKSKSYFIESTSSHLHYFRISTKLTTLINHSSNSNRCSYDRVPIFCSPNRCNGRLFSDTERKVYFQTEIHFRAGWWLMTLNEFTFSIWPSSIFNDDCQAKCIKNYYMQMSSL